MLQSCFLAPATNNERPVAVLTESTGSHDMKDGVLVFAGKQLSQERIFRVVGRLDEVLHSLCRGKAMLFAWYE